MSLDKSEFIEYLESLPTGNPFCVNGNCPISQWRSHVGFPYFIMGTEDYFPRGIGVGEITCPAPRWAANFVNKVDANTKPWEKLTPEECLDVVRKV